jgi:hypothetical protein
MKLTIIATDGCVYKDKVSYSELILNTVPSNIHALQFDTNKNVGWIEFVDNADGTKSANNKTIFELPSWGLDAIAEWDSADVLKTQIEEEKKRIEEANKLEITSSIQQ